MECVLSRGKTGVTTDDVKLFLLFYADDAVIFAESVEELQNGIDILHDYCNRWKLLLNTEKSQIVCFKKGRRSHSEKWKYGDHELKVVTSLSYLGIRISATGSFHQAQNTLAAQASKAVFSLSKNLNNFPGLKPKHAMELFDKLISPILNYGSEVWGFHDAPEIERVHLKFCKNILGVKTRVQNDFVYGELHILPIKYARTINIFKYWLKIVHGEKSIYVNTCYLSSLKMMETSDADCWARFVKCMLESNGFSDVWLCQGVGDRELFVKIFTERLNDILSELEWETVYVIESHILQ